MVDGEQNSKHNGNNYPQNGETTQNDGEWIGPVQEFQGSGQACVSLRGWIFPWTTVLTSLTYKICKYIQMLPHNKVVDEWK